MIRFLHDRFIKVIFFDLNKRHKWVSKITRVYGIFRSYFNGRHRHPAQPEPVILAKVGIHGQNSKKVGMQVDSSFRRDDRLIAEKKTSVYKSDESGIPVTSYFNGLISNTDKEKQDCTSMLMDSKAGEEGIRFFNNGDYLSAIINLDAALFCSSENLSYYKIRGLSYMHLGAMVEAIKDFSTLIEHDKNKPEYFIKRGYLYEKIGFLPRAISDYRQVLRFNPHTWGELEKTDLFMDLTNKGKKVNLLLMMIVGDSS